ncbi:MAG: CheR family methyltransferase [Candidatus Anammoxibacter sp.]
MILTPEEFNKFRDLINEKCGIYFEEKKLYMLKKRIENRLKITNTKEPKDYYRLIKYDPRGNELNIFIDSLTTNETYFFREAAQLNGFADDVLPVLLEEKRKGVFKKMKIWSAACSTGCEPYTLSILLREKIKDFNAWDIQVYGTDISSEILKKCRSGMYTERDVKDVPLNYKTKYFKNSGATFEIAPEIKAMVKFSLLNFLDKMMMRSMRDFDVIFCRNVLIYFTDEVRKKVVNQLYDSLKQGGYIFLGHADSMARISAAFKLKKFNNTLAYCKE